MKSEPLQIKCLEEIANKAQADIESNAGSEFELNYMISSVISIENLKDNPISRHTKEAKLWAAKERPVELQINHGEYIKDGLEHIVKELRNKVTSNRALFSLMSHEDIVNTGDKPIPSFMIMQCNIHNNILYCTSYFRALEVSSFFRVNLEELRLKICKIHNEVRGFDSVNITVFAFRAYINEDINPLRVPEIDRMSAIKLRRKLISSPKEVADLLREKFKASTVINADSIINLIDAIKDIKSESVLDYLNLDLIIKYAEDVIKDSSKLKILREKDSHHRDIDTLNGSLRKNILNIVKELEFE